MTKSAACIVAIAIGTCAAQAGSLRVGAARVDITPAANPTNPPTGKYEHEHLCVRAIVLDNGETRAALIGGDAGGFADNIWGPASKQIAAELKCPVENIVMSATHSHSAGFGPPPRPGQGGQPAAPAANQPAPPVVGQIVDAVRQARAKLQPAKFGFGTGFSYLNVNRDNIDSQTHKWTQAPNLEAPSDKTVAVLKFESMVGEPIAVYVNYAMHPVNGYLSGFTSGDFPGAASRYIEQAYGDKLVAVWTQGASGDQNPLYLRPSTNAMASRGSLPITGNVLVREPVEARIRDGSMEPGPLDPKVRDQLERWMEAEGMLLGEEVIRVMTNTTRMDASPRIQAAQNAVSCPGRKRTNTGREGEPGVYEDAGPVSIRLGVLRIGNTALTSVNAEIYSEIGMRMKKESPVANTVMVTLANGRADSGYIPNDASFGAYTFQVLGSRLKPGCAETAIVNGLVDMIQAQSR